MVKVANLSADLTANTSTFDQRLQRSSNTLRRTGQQMSRSAENFNQKVSGSFKRAAQTAAAFEGPLGGVAGRLSTLSSISGGAGIAIGGIALAVAGLSLALTKAVKTGDQFEGSMNRVKAIIKATGGAAGVSADDIRKFSQELARGTLASVEGVEAASAKLLTFRSIAGDTFFRTLTLAQDLAATGFGSLSDNVTQLGKALEDPIRNLGALTRNGVSFTQAQKDVIKSLVETGQAAKAQSIILDALAQQVGGAGGAEGGALSKAYDSLTQSVDNFFILLDEKWQLSERAAEGLDRLRESVDGVNDSLGQLSRAEVLAQGGESAIELMTKDLARLEAQLQRAKERMSLDAFMKSDTGNSQRIIDNLTAQIAKIKERIKAEQDLIQSVKDQAAAEQAKIEADRLAGIEQEKQKKLAEERAKLEEQRQKQIATTIEGLRNEVAALEVENGLLQQGNVSIEEATLAREILAMQQRLNIDATTEEGQAINDLVRERAALKQSIDEEAKLRARVKEIIKENQTETQRLNAELVEFKKLRDEGRLSEEEYAKAVERTREKINDLDESQKRLKETAKEVGQATSSVFKDMVFGATKASDAVKQLGLKLLEIVYQKTVGAGIESVVGSAVSSIFGGFFADGGRPPMGRVSIVGEQGPELFVPDTAGTIVPNNALSGNGSNGPTIFADLRGASVEAVMRLEQLVSELNGSLEPRAINAIVSAKQRNPALFGDT